MISHLDRQHAQSLRAHPKPFTVPCSRRCDPLGIGAHGSINHLTGFDSIHSAPQLAVAQFGH